MALFISGARTADGGSYTPASTNNNCVLWIAYGYRNGGTTSASQTFGGTAMVEEHDNNNNIAGGGDPVTSCSYIVGEPATSQVLDIAYSGAMSNEDGFALTIENVDQTTPVYPTNGSNSGTYLVDLVPSLSYDAPANSTVIYYKFHGATSSITFTTPVGFTEIAAADHLILTSPAFRHIKIYKKDVVSAEVGSTVVAETNVATGGVHGVIVLQTAAAVTEVQIADVDTDNIVFVGQTGVVITGQNFEVPTGTVTISPTDDVNDANAVTLTSTAWSDTSVTVDIPASIAMLYGTRYMFITTDTAEVNAAGFVVTLNPIAANAYVIIKEQNDQGVLKDVTGLQLDSDQLEYQILSNAGGTVYMGVSGTFYIYDYAAAVPASDIIYVRLGDESDQTWSAAAVEAITLEVPAAGASSGDVTQTLNSFSQTASGTEISIIDGDVTQTLNSFSQTVNGTNLAIKDGDVTQTLNSFSQALSGTEISIINGDVTQTLNSFTQALAGTAGAAGATPTITQPPHATVSAGNTFTYTPTLATGTDVQWVKEYGPDAMTVDPETGQISWDTTNLPRGQGMRITIGCSNDNGEDLKTFAIHVDELGTSKLMLLNGAVDTAGGTPTTIATTIRAAAAEINSGDTLIIPDGHFFASTTEQNSAENTWDEQNLNQLPSGLSNQHTTIMSDGYTIIDSAAHDAIVRDDKGLSSGPTNTGEFYKFSGIEWTGSNRGPIVFRINGTLLDFCGGTDGSYAVTPLTQAEAGDPFANVAGTYIGGNSTAENCFGFGDARYIFQAGNFVTACSFNRCIARPDEYNGTNPRGGIVHYSVDDSGTFSSYVIDGDQEHLSPFYNNYAGAFGLPATGNETHAQSQLMRGCAAINVDMNAILNDSTSAANTLVIEDFLLLDTTNTVTPWTHATSLMGIQSDSVIDVTRLAMSETHRWDFSTVTGGVFMGASTGSTIDGAIFDRLGWDGVSATIDLADLVDSEVTIDNTNIYDFAGSVDAAGSSTPTTNITTYDPKINGWDYPTRSEDGSPIDTLAQAPDLTKFAAPSGYLPEDAGWDVATNDWAWPHPEEQHIAARMATYSKSGMAVRNPLVTTDPVDLTGTITGARGFAAVGESFSEYVWGQFGRTVPPLRVSAKATSNGEVTFRIGKYRSTRGDTITKFNVYETSDLINSVGTTTTLKSVITGIAAGTRTYIIKAVDTTQTSAWGANESGESGPSRELTVTITADATSSGDVAQTLNSFSQTLNGTEISIIDGDTSQTLNSFTQALSGTEISIIDSDVTQTLNSFTQAVVGTNNQILNSDIAQTLNSFSQTASGTSVAAGILTGDVTQTLNSFSQALSGTEISIIDGDVTQTLNSFSQTASGTNNQILNSDVAQTLNSFSQTLTATEISIIDSDVTQTLNSFSQTASGTNNQILNSDIAQTLNSFTQALSGTEISIIDGDVTQTLNSFSQDAVGTVPIPGQSSGDVTQTLNSFSQALAGTEISIIDSDVTQTLNNFSQTASGTNNQILNSNIAQTLNSFSQALTATEISIIDSDVTQALNSFSQIASGVITKSVSGDVTQTLNSFSQIASGTNNQILNSDIAQTLNSFTQLANGSVNALNGSIIAQTLNSFTQSLIATEISIIDSAVTQTLNSFSQALAGTEISIIDSDVTQTLNSFTQSLVATEISIIDGDVTQTLNSFTQAANGFKVFPDINILTTFDSFTMTEFNVSVLIQNINSVCRDELKFIIDDSSDISYVLQDSLSMNYTINTIEDLSFVINDTEDLTFNLSDCVVITAVADDTEGAVAFATRIDAVGDEFIYKGEAVPGTLDADADWRIRRIQFIGDDVTITWADGTEVLNKIWNNRLVYIYS